MMKKKRTFTQRRAIIYRKTCKAVTRFIKDHLILLSATLAAVAFLGDKMNSWGGFFGDGDGYMHALRIYHLILNPGIFEQPILESNYPFGEVLHWTRLTDIAWLLSMTPYLCLEDLKEAVFLGGAVMSPLIGVISAMMFVYGIRRQFNVYTALFGCILFVVYQPSYFSPWSADHHALTMFFGITALSLTLCWFKKRHNRYLRLIGFSLALMTFNAIEGFIVYALFLGFFLQQYVFKNISLMPAVKISKYFALALCGLWLIDPPYQGWFYPDNGRASVLFVTLSALIFATLYLLDKSRLHTVRLKLLSLICTALGSILLVLVIFGANILNSPMDSDLYNTWGYRIQEMQPISQQSWQEILSYYFFAVLALLIAFRWRQKKPYARIMQLCLCLGVPLLILSLGASRFSYYQLIYAIPPVLCVVEEKLKQAKYLAHTDNQYGRVWAVMMLFLLALTLKEFPDNLKTVTQGAAPIQKTMPACEKVREIGGTLITDVFLAPMYVWNCDVTTVGTPYHRNRNGILDNEAILDATDDGALIPLLLKHQVSQILLFDDYAEERYDLDGKNADKLYYRLLKNQNVPEFLEEVPSYEKTVHHYRLKI
jgi:hypothetical protein